MARGAPVQLAEPERGVEGEKLTQAEGWGHKADEDTRRTLKKGYLKVSSALSLRAAQL